MGQRIRQLEDALAIFQAGVSNECHALLRDDLLAIKFGPENGKAPEKRSSDLSADAIDALGTLTIGDHGEAKYFGRSAGSEVRLYISLWFPPAHFLYRLYFWYGASQTLEISFMANS